MCGGGCEWRWPPRRGGRWEEREHAVRARASDGDEAAQLGLAVFAPCVSYVAMPAAMLLLVCGAQRKTLLPETMVTAAYNGDTRAVAAWLDAGGSVNAQTSLHPRDLGWTLLAKAADRGHETLLHMLLERGAATEQNIGTGLTALMMASLNGQEGAVRLLVNAGAIVDQVDASAERVLP